MKTYASKVFSRVISNALGVVKEGTPATDDQGHKGVWVTMQGRAIFIRDGETAEVALGRATGEKPAERPEDARNVRAIEARRTALLARQPKEPKDGKERSAQEQLQEQVDQARAARERREAGTAELKLRRKQEADAAKKKAEQARESLKPKPVVDEGQGTRRSIHQKAKNLASSLAIDGFKVISSRKDEKLGDEKDGVQQVLEEHSVEEWKHPDGRKVSIHEIEDKKTWDHKGTRDDAPMRLEVQRSSK